MTKFVLFLSKIIQINLKLMWETTTKYNTKWYMYLYQDLSYWENLWIHTHHLECLEVVIQVYQVVLKNLESFIISQIGVYLALPFVLFPHGSLLALPCHSIISIVLYSRHFRITVTNFLNPPSRHQYKLIQTDLNIAKRLVWEKKFVNF